MLMPYKQKVVETLCINENVQKKSENAKKLHSILTTNSDKPIIFLPDAGAEFGLRILAGIRLVYFHLSKNKIVCCRKSEICLYPKCKHFTEWIDPISDCHVNGGNYNDIKWKEILKKFPDYYPLKSIGWKDVLNLKKELILIEPNIKIPFTPNKKGLKVKVVIGTRARKHDEWKNWSHWQKIGDKLKKNNISYAVVGSENGSCEIKGMDYISKNTDEVIELMQNADLFIGTDSGTSHLACEIGCKMIVFRNNERNTWYKNFFPTMQFRNSNVNIVENGWNKPNEVIDAVFENYK